MKPWFPLVVALSLAPACRGDEHCDDGHVDEECPAEPMAHTVFVAGGGELASYELGTGEKRPGTIDDVDGPFGMQVLADGHVLVNLSERDEILVVEGSTMVQVTRIPTSNTRASRPVRSYITPDRKLWVSLNDGSGGSAAFIDLRHGSDDQFRLIGEVELGAGHHEAAFSTTRARALFTNASDCDVVMAVYDHDDIEDIHAVATMSAADAGLDGDDPGADEFADDYCDPTGERGPAPMVHGCAAAANGHAFCNMAGTGDIVAVNLDEDEPGFELLETSGTGAGAMRLHPGGRYLYTLQAQPRQLVVLDSRTDDVVAELPLCYHGPDCDGEPADDVWNTTYPGQLTFSLDGDTLYAGLAYVSDRLMVVDVRDPANPEQRDSIAVGGGTGGQDVLSGDGELLVHVDTDDGTLSLVDAPSRRRLGTIDVGDAPAAVATYGSDEGPSQQTGPFFD